MMEATTDLERLRAFMESEQTDKLQQLESACASWSDSQCLTALATSIKWLKVSNAVEKGQLNKALFKLCSRGDDVLLHVLRPLLKDVVSRDLVFDVRTDESTLRESTGVLTKACLFALKNAKADKLLFKIAERFVDVANVCLKSSELQIVVNGAQIVAARCAAQSYHKDRTPDEVCMYAKAGSFELLGKHVGNRTIFGPVWNAIMGLMVSPAALEDVKPDGVLVQQLKKLRDSNKQAAQLLDSLELTHFKRVVKEKTKGSKDGGSALGNELLGIVGASKGAQHFGFQFTNKQIEKDLKDTAFKEGVIRPMAEKMREEGEDVNVDNIAKSVLRDFTKPKVMCSNPGCDAAPEKVTKRCGRCMAASYCGAQCQKTHWPSHKLDCKKE